MRRTKKSLTKPTSNDNDAGETVSDFLSEQREKKHVIRLIILAGRYIKEIAN